MLELACDHTWVNAGERHEDYPADTLRQQCRCCGDIRHVRIVNGDIVLVNGITRAVLAWEDDGGRASD